MNTEAKSPPYDQSAELAVLGGILLSNDVFGSVRGIVEPSHFYLEIHRITFKAMIDVFDSGSPVDHVTLGEQLSRDGQYDRIGGASFLGTLTDNASTIANIEHHAGIVREKHSIRGMVYAAQEIVSRGLSGFADAENYLTESRASITEAANGFQLGGGPEQIDNDLKTLISQLESCEPPKGIVPTGISAIDSVTGGLWPGLLTVVAARPSMGKSAFALNVAINAALSGLKVYYVTLEDVREYIVARLMSRFADIDFQDITLRTKFGSDAWTRIIAAYSTLSGRKPIWVDDLAGLTSRAIVQRAAQLQAGDGLDLVVVDHLGEISDKGNSEKERLESGARIFRDGAKEQHVPYMALHQLNRYVEHRNDKTPNMADLNQAGQLEAIARVVWFLLRPGYYEPTGEERHDMELLVAKATHGKTGMIRLWQDWSRMYVRSWDSLKDGPFPSDSTEEEARQNARDRDGGKKGGAGNKQANLFGGAHAQENWENRGGNEY